MTNKEALIAKLNYPISDASVDVAIVDRGILGGQTYSVGNKSNIELATMDLLYLTLTQPDVIEGGYQLSHPDFFRKVKERLLQLASLNGATDILELLNPSSEGIVDVSYLW